MNIIEIVKKSILDLKSYWSIAFLASLFISLLSLSVQYDKTIGLLLLLIFTGPFKSGISKISLDILEKKEISISHIFDGFKIFKNSLGVFLLSTVFIVLGLICFIVPGIIIMIWLSQSFFVLVENPMLEPLEVFKKSREIIKGKEVDYFLLLLFFTLITVLLFFTKLFFIGLLITPIQYVAFANFYKKL